MGRVERARVRRFVASNVSNLSACTCVGGFEDVHKKGCLTRREMGCVRACARVPVCALGEGVTIVCACLTEPLWQREREGANTLAPALCEGEGLCVSSCECMNRG